MFLVTVECTFVPGTVVLVELFCVFFDG